MRTAISSKRTSYFFAILTVMFWSTSATAFKIGLRHLNYVQLLFFTSFFSFLFFFLIALVTGKLQGLKKLTTRELFLLGGLGFLNPFLYYLMIFKAYDLLPAQVAQPLNFIWPVVLVLLSVPLLKQKIKPVNLLALLISFTGVFFISSQGSYFQIPKGSGLGIALALSSSVVWSLFWIFNLKSKSDDLSKLLVSFGFSSMYAFVFLLFASELRLSVHGFFSAAYISLFEMGLTFFLWIKALRMAGKTSFVSNLIYLIPFGAVMVVHFVLKEPLYASTFIGIFLILTGILVQDYMKKRDERKQQRSINQVKEKVAEV